MFDPLEQSFIFQYVWPRFTRKLEVHDVICVVCLILFPQAVKQAKAFEVGKLLRRLKDAELLESLKGMFTTRS